MRDGQVREGTLRHEAFAGDDSLLFLFPRQRTDVFAGSPPPPGVPVDPLQIASIRRTAGWGAWSVLGAGLGVPLDVLAVGAIARLFDSLDGLGN